ncbi:MAG TPA: hypothetical protein VFQ60_02290 [Patescibacteria group bacterium]|nr:hypothetical protein [Patescibacteria group bacterium]
MEKVESKQEHRFLDRPEIQRVIENRDIRPEHFFLLERLAAEVPQRIFLENHNTFSSASSGAERGRILKAQFLRDQARYASSNDLLDEWRAKWHELMLSLMDAYDWPTAWNVNTTFEKLPRDAFFIK